MNLNELIDRIEHSRFSNVDKSYRPNLNIAFDIIDKPVTFAFEKCYYKNTFKLLRLMNGRRTMDFENDQNNSLWVTNNNSQQTTIHFDDMEHLIELISSLPCYPEYSISVSDYFAPKGTRMTKEEIKIYLTNILTS